MKVLLLGGTGTLSTEVLRCSQLSNYITSVLNRGIHRPHINELVQTYIADLRNSESVAKALGDDKFDVIVDFYSRTKEDILRLFPIMSYKCQQYVFISSACVYCRNNKDIKPIIENSPKPNILWQYNVHKYEAEQQLKSMSTKSACYYTIVRPYITYNDERIPWGIAPAYHNHRTIIERIKSGKPMFIWDNGDNYCTLTYCGDFAKAVVGLFLNPKAINEDFHITSDNCHQWKDALNLLYKELHITPNIVSLPSTTIARYLPEYKGELLGDRSLNAIFDNSKIKAAIPNIELSTSLEKGLRKVILHYENLKTYDYDFKYDARIDRMLSIVGVKGLHFVPYYKSAPNARKIYSAYRYLPLRLANILIAHI